MKSFTILSGAALLAVAGGVAIAQGPGQRPDRNADVTRDQVIARTSEAFARLDANHDGRFTPDEARARGEARRTERRAHMFDRLDANHDGNVSRDEFSQAHGVRGEGRPGMGHRRMGPPPGGPDGPEGGPPPGGPDGPRGPGARMFGEQGFMTLEQMRDRALARFDRADANHDGTLTAAERREARGQMRERMRDPRRPD
jgi:Ca2+-binding EF-hand superfamily protein